MAIASRVQGSVAPPVIDYEGSPYRQAFWEGQGRDYEDTVERFALRSLLPAHGVRIAEIGAGFGRLADLYLGYEQIILFDYSRTLLQDAVERWGHDPRFVFVAGNLYQLPLATASLDSFVMVRVMHHLADVPQALRQIHRVMHRHSVAVLEYANKRNLKAILRWLAGGQPWSPLAPEPVEFVPLNFDFHPRWMAARMAEAQLSVRLQLAVSHFRISIVKKRIDPRRLAQVDRLLFRLGGRFPLAPSVFVQALTPTSSVRVSANGGSANGGSAVADLFRCPHCEAEAFELRASKQLLCQVCGKRFEQRGGIWDFKETVS